MMIFKNNVFVIYMTCKLPIVWKFKKHHVLLEFWVYHGVPDFTKVSRHKPKYLRKRASVLSACHTVGERSGDQLGGCGIPARFLA